MADSSVIGADKRAFSCAACYQSKRKCDKGNPCSHCLSKNLDCSPSAIETTQRPRKRRFPEAELLDRIAKYEAALVSYGVNPSSIQNDTAASKRNQSSSPTPITSITPEDVTASFIAVIEGQDGTQESNTTSAHSWYDDVFAQDGSSLLFAVDPNDVPEHPSPFDIFKLWQVYRDNVNPISKLLHAPTFQRSISSYGSLLHLAPAADQSLFFAVYTAAIASLSAEKCMEVFSSSKEVMLEQYKLAAQVWLRRAYVWRTSDLTVLQSFVLFLSSIQNTIDPRTLACFTGVADRIARRIGLHRDVERGVRPLDREMRTRIWWEITLIDSKAVERAGLGTSVSTGRWDARLPSSCSDADLECMDGVSSLERQSAPSSEMICFVIRAEILLFTAELHSERKGKLVNSIDNFTLVKRLRCIEDFEKRLQARYLSFCDKALPIQRLTLLFAQAAMSRLRISAYIVEDSTKATIGLELLRHCTDNLDFYTQMRSDALLKPFKWFILQSLPVFAYINLLRLLQEYNTGEVVDRAWRVLQSFKGAGPKRVADSLMLKAWEAKKKATSYIIDDPHFVKEIYKLVEFPSEGSSLDSASNAAFSEADMMALMAEILSSEVYSDLSLNS